MHKIKKGMLELEELKRINRELTKIYQGQEQSHPHDHEQINTRYQAINRTYPSVRRQSNVSTTSMCRFLFPAERCNSATFVRRVVGIVEFRNTTTTISTQ